MLASQLIYTGCGKNKTGAFEVWSKSADITKAEENEIRDKMIYKRPPELPSAPTQEELDTVFPKKFAYFFLSSGRACIAQSTYIGKVYSDLDMRTGNYIIHAFVFDKTDAIVPMNYMYNPIFKEGLTYQEWHHDGAPADLAQVDFPESADPITKQELDAFFSENGTSNFKLLLQAVLNSLSSDKKVTFNDSFKKLNLWYKALSVCVPKSKQKEMTYSTFFTPSVMLASQMQAGGGTQSTDIKIRNIASNVSANMFNYQQEARKGNYAFNFETGLLPDNLVVGKYVNALVDLLQTNLFKAIMLVDTVSKISALCGVDCDTALEINYLLTKQISYVNEVEKLEGLVDYVERYYGANVADVADSLYEYGIAGGNWQMSSRYVKLFKFVFNNSRAVDKNEMIAKYISNQGAFGVDCHAGPEEYAQSFKRNAPFDWSYFLDYAFSDSDVKKHLAECGGTFSAKYLFFDAIVESMASTQKTDEQKRYAMQFFVSVAGDCVRAESLREMNILLKSIEKGGAKNRAWLVKTTFASVRGGRRLSDVCSYQFVLDMVEACGDEATATALLGELMLENESNMDFVKTYIERSERNGRIYSPLMSILEKEEKYRSFLDSLEIYKFSLGSTVTKRLLKDYFDNFYAKGKDNGLFKKKVRQYLADLRGSDVINEGLELFTVWFKNMGSLNSNDMECATSICRAVFDASEDALKTYIAANGATRLKEMLSAVNGSGFTPPAAFYVIAFGEKVKRLVEEIRSDKNSKWIEETKKRLADKEFYTAIPKDDTAKEMFVKMYLKNIFDLYILLANEENYVTLYISTFGPISGCAGYKNTFAKTIDGLKEDNFNTVLKATVIAACHENNKLGDYLKELSAIILEDIGRGRRKKFFALLLDKLPEKYQEATKAFVDGYDKMPKSPKEKEPRVTAPKGVEPREKNEKNGQDENKGGFFQRLFGGIFGGKK